jgi:hypothetical protein
VHSQPGPPPVWQLSKEAKGIMEAAKNRMRFVIGFLLIILGGICIWGANYFSSNQTNTFYSPELISAGLYFLGFIIAGIGLITIVIGIFSRPGNPPPPNDTNNPPTL